MPIPPDRPRLIAVSSAIIHRPHNLRRRFGVDFAGVNHGTAADVKHLCGVRQRNGWSGWRFFRKQSVQICTLIYWTMRWHISQPRRNARALAFRQVAAVSF
jgi:hypothetical protein